MSDDPSDSDEENDNEKKERRRDEEEADISGQENTNVNWNDEDNIKEVVEKSKEDLEFEQMFEKMAADSYQERLKETIKPNTKDIPVPMMAKNSKKSYDQIQGGSSTAGSGSGGNGTNLNANESKDAAAVPFVLMVRGGKGKQQFKTFVAPSDSHLAINLKLQEQEIREENEKVKRLTLNITERIEEKDYQGKGGGKAESVQASGPKHDRVDGVFQLASVSLKLNWALNSYI